jgi:hypothetical protein
MSHVSEFGAIGDGRTDDTEAIQHAIQKGDGLVQFGRGTYVISSTIDVRLNETKRLGIDGSNGIAKIVMAGKGPAFRLIGTHGGTADPNSFQPEIWARQRLPQICGLEIEGQHPEADGIELRGTMQCIVSRVALRGLRHGIRLFERNRNVLITDCQIYHNTGVGIFLDRVNLHQINITGNHVSYNRLGGIRIEGSEVRNLQITGNDIEYNNYRAFTDAVPDDPTAEIYIDSRGNENDSPRPSVREFTIASNTIQATHSPNGANIRILGPDPTGNLPPGMSTISGNVIGNQEINIHLVGCRGIAIGNNFIYTGYQHNLLADQCDDLSITGNTIGHNSWVAERMTDNNFRLQSCTDTVLGSLELRGAPLGQTLDTNGEPRVHLGLIELEDCRRINVSGCILRDPANAGLAVNNSQWINVTGCQIVDSREAGKIMRHAVTWTGPGNNNQIAASLLGAGTKGLHSIDKESGVRVM